jgi:DNA-binding beta-propeller fold protein YncE
MGHGWEPEGDLIREIAAADVFVYIDTPEFRWARDVATQLQRDYDDVTVIDLVAGEVTGRIDLGGSAFVGTWDPSHRKLYVPVRSNDEVAVIDHGDGAVTTRLDAGASPYGATAATVRPGDPDTSTVGAAIAHLGRQAGEIDTTYCVGECACGHEL